MLIEIAVLALPYYINSSYTYSTDDKNASVGKRVLLNFNGRKKYGLITKILPDDYKPDFDVKKIDKVIDEDVLVTDEIIELCKWMSEFYISSLSACLTLALPSPSSTGLTRLFKTSENEVKPAPVMSVEQSRVYTAFANKIGQGFSMSYLWGVTGSGKTLVFLSLAKKCIDNGKEVLYLVPEIGLTVQLYNALLGFFDKDEIAIIHSAISPTARIAIWKKVRKKEIKIVVGTRSAVFAPFDNLGLIIMDEEQDGSYKSDNSPTFSTRHLVWWRAKHHGCPAVAGSATPSFEFLKMIREKSIDTQYLTKRIGEYKMPKIVCINSVDMLSPISEGLEKAMREELDKGRQVILFLNRRGYLYHYKCPECGYELLCPHCSVNMTYHRQKNLFICHRCSHTEKAFTSCPECGCKNEIYFGYGTEYAERIVNQLFPFSSTIRMDTDTVTSEKIAQKMIDDFEKHKVDILIGTQMISKGLNFPSVSLVGILNAASSTSQGDFRSDEKLFNLLTQVAGRSGRAMSKSRVILQSDDSSLPVIKAIESARSDEFYTQQLEIRKRFCYPPYSRLARLVVRSRDEFCADDTIKAIAELINTFIRAEKDKSINVISYGKCPIYKEKDYYRRHIIMRSADVKNLIRAIRYIKEKLKYTNSFFLEIDIDPLNMF